MPPNELAAKILPLDRLLSTPMPPMLIQGYLPKNALVLLSSAPGVGKTFFTVEVVRALATGTPFMGEFKVPNPGRILFVEEDSPNWDIANQFRKVIGAHVKQIRAEQDTFGWSDPDRTSLLNPYRRVYTLANFGFSLDNDESVRDLVASANSLVTLEGADRYEQDYRINEDGTYILSDPELVSGAVATGVDLIVLDTLRSMHNFEEQDSTAMQHIMERVKYIQRETGAAILLLHHDRKTSAHGGLDIEAARGSTAIVGAVDAYLSLRRTKAKGPTHFRPITCAVVKSRAVQSSSFTFRMVEEDKTYRFEVCPDPAVKFKEEKFDVLEAKFLALIRSRAGEWVGSGALASVAKANGDTRSASTINVMVREIMDAVVTKNPDIEWAAFHGWRLRTAKS